MGRQRKTVTYELPSGRLWPNTPSGAELAIEVFGATGDYKAGKTLLGLSIAPGVHPEGHEFAGKPRTLYLDFEKSGGTYGGTGCKRIDIPDVMLKLYTNEQSGRIETYGPLDIFEWFLQLVDHLLPRQFDVIMADPITDLEGGLVGYVRKYCKNFGMTEAQMSKAGGLLWGAVKDFQKQVLLKLSAKCQTFYFTSHLRSVWEGDRPVRGKKEPKGKETLMELAGLYLWLERQADKEGNVPAVPSAIVLKERLADTVINADGKLSIIQLMPPRLPKGTVGAIREYIARPPDYQKLRDDEKVVEEEMSEEDKLRLKESIAHADKEAQEGRLAVLTRQAELQALARRGKLAAPQPADQTAKRQAEKAASEKVKAERDALQAQIDAKQGKVDSEQKEIDADMAKANAGVETMAAETKRLVESQPEEYASASYPNWVITDEQVIELAKLTKELRITKEQLVKILDRVKCKKVRDLTKDLASKLIDQLKALWVDRESVKKDKIPF